MTGELSRLHKLIADSYDLDEFRTLCMDLGVRYDDLGGEGLSGRVRELVLYTDLQRQLDQLLKAVSQQCPANFDFDLSPAAIEALYGQLPTLSLGCAGRVRVRHRLPRRRARLDVQARHALPLLWH